MFGFSLLNISENCNSLVGKIAQVGNLDLLFFLLLHNISMENFQNWAFAGKKSVRVF